MSIGLASDSRGKVIISVAFASCVIGGIGYLKYIQNQQNVSRDRNLFAVHKDAHMRKHIRNLSKMTDCTVRR